MSFKLIFSTAISALLISEATHAQAQEVPVEVVYTHLTADEVHNIQGIKNLSFPATAIFHEPAYTLEKQVGSLRRVFLSADPDTENQLCKMVGYAAVEKRYPILTSHKATNKEMTLVYDKVKNSFFISWKAEKYLDRLPCKVENAFSTLAGTNLPKAKEHTSKLTAELIQIVPDFPGIPPFAAIKNPQIIVEPKYTTANSIFYYGYATLEKLFFDADKRTQNVICQAFGYGEANEVPRVTGSMTRSGVRTQYNWSYYEDENGNFSSPDNNVFYIATCASESPKPLFRE